MAGDEGEEAEHQVGFGDGAGLLQENAPADHGKILVGNPRAPLLKLLEQGRARGRDVLQHLHHEAMNGAGVVEVGPHP